MKIEINGALIELSQEQSNMVKDFVISQVLSLHPVTSKVSNAHLSWKKWTLTEKKLIRNITKEQYGSIKKGIEAVAQQLGRSISSITAKRVKLSKYHPSPFGKKGWTQDEDMVIKSLEFGSQPKQEVFKAIAPTLNRSHKSVSARYWKLMQSV